MKTKRKRPNGFTLVEIMAVILILSLVIGIAAKNFIGMTDKARVTTTRATLKELHAAVNMFKLDTGRYPTEEEGLYALIERPGCGRLVRLSDTTDVHRHLTELVYMLNLADARVIAMGRTARARV